LKIGDKYVDYQVLVEFCKDRHLPLAPVLYIGPYNKEMLKSFTEGKTVLGPNKSQIKEGCVVKPLSETFDNSCGRKILKSISTEYLLTKKHDAPEEYVDDSTEYAH
jgi:hypothetical protein